MRCAQCAFENPDGIRFCGACGAALDWSCPICGQTSPSTFSFCGHCGARFADPSVRPGPGLAAERLPPALRVRGLEEGRGLAGEHRRVTALFADMAGFSRVTRALGAEQAYAMMERVYEVLIDAVYEFEGTVNDMTGDGVLALFGAPVALENAPERAIRAALAIHGRLTELGDLGTDGISVRPQVRIGINTGPVVVGRLGTDLRIELKAVGDTVNLASRLEELAPPGSTLVGEETHRLAAGRFGFEPIVFDAVPGREGPVRAFRVIERQPVRSRLELRAQRGLSPHIGRERELEMLGDALSRAVEGRGQAVSIVAEAGLGKSRLLHEFRNGLPSGTVTYLEGRCQSFGRGMTYYPVVDLLRASFGLDEDEEAASARTKLQAGLEALGVDAGSVGPALAELLLAGDDVPGADLTPEARKAQLTRALTEVLVTASRHRPVVVAIEDLHWVDPSSEDLIARVLDAISAAPVLLLLTFRPEYPQQWGARSYHSHLTLNRLSNRETLDLARHQVGGELDEPLARLVLEKTDGVPFFIEEFCRSLDELGLVEVHGDVRALASSATDVTVPTTIQDVLRARVDRLPEAAKDLLKTASVLGREVRHDLLRSVAGVSEDELLAGLSALRESELLYERGMYPESTYIFKHALTQEVVYGSLLADQRRMLHRRAGEAIAGMAGSGGPEHHAVLAGHFIAAEEWERGALHSRRAGRGAHQAGAIPTAVAHAREAVRCLSRLPVGPEVLEQAIAARAMLAGYVLITGKPHEAAKAVAPIAEVVREREHRTAMPAVDTALGLDALFGSEDLDAAMRHLDPVFALSESRAVAPWQWFAGYYLGNYLAWECDFEGSAHMLELAAGIGDRASNSASSGVARASHALTLMFKGDLAEAWTLAEKAAADSTAAREPTAESLSGLVLGAVACARGRFDTARTHLLGPMRSTRELEQDFWRGIDISYLADAHLGLGDARAAIPLYEESLRILEEPDTLPSWQRLFRLKLAHARAAGAVDVPDVEELALWRSEMRFPVFEGLTARLIARVVVETGAGEPDRAQHWLDAALEADERNHLPLERAHDLVLSADLHRLMGRAGSAVDDMAEARRLFVECGAVGHAESAGRALADLRV